MITTPKEAPTVMRATCLAKAVHRYGKTQTWPSMHAVLVYPDGQADNPRVWRLIEVTAPTRTEAECVALTQAGEEACSEV